jgi:hypothetical protein
VAGSVREVHVVGVAIGIDLAVFPEMFLSMQTTFVPIFDSPAEFVRPVPAAYEGNDTPPFADARVALTSE